jgi:Protein of unknown function (DUF2891)
MATAFLLTAELAQQLADSALGHVTREYPNKLDHVLTAEADVQAPRALHPVFYGSFDWHSCVHGYWLLARLRRAFPHLPLRARIDSLFDTQLTMEKLAAERAYLMHPANGGFERPYGWAWLLMLAAELRRGGPETVSWHQALTDLAQAFADRFRAHLPKLTYPIRTGTHFNSAFALALALEYAPGHGDTRLAELIRERARNWFQADAGCQAWEPSGDDFLSPALMEAECLRRILGPSEFVDWFTRFLPGAATQQPAVLFSPASVSDRSDGKIAHLDGLNLSRAWCWRSIAGSFAPDHPVRVSALAAAERHLAASIPHIAVDYMGAHWLGSFALLALDAAAPPDSADP